MQAKAATDQKDSHKQLTSVERRLVASVTQLKQRRQVRWQEKVLKEGTSPSSVFVMF